MSSLVGLGYIVGLWSPGFCFHGKRAQKVLHNLIEAHVQAYDMIHTLDDLDADGDGISSIVGFSQLNLRKNIRYLVFLL